MSRAAWLPAVWVACILAPCSASASPQSDSSTPISVKGTERIAWDQTAPRGGWIVGFRFTAYVDGEPLALPDASCTPIFCAQCGCAAPLPRMSSGIHRIEITARDVFGSESARSAPIYIALGSSSTPSSTIGSSARQTLAARSSPTSGLRTPKIEVLTASLNRPSAIAVAPDGRIIIAERDGAIVIWKDGRLQARLAATIGDVAPGADAGLVGLTLDPDFSTNARVFVAYSSRDAAGAFANRIVRYREVAGIFGEAAVIFDDRVSEPPPRTPRIRFGPDRKLYVLFAGGANAGVATGAAYAGMILRLNEDGSTPKDNPGSTPVFDKAAASTSAFDWQPETHMMWRSDRAAVIAFYGSGRIAGSTGELLEVGLDGDHISRSSFDPADRSRVTVTARWFENAHGRITDLVVGPDGMLYFCGVNEKTRAGVLARVVER